MNLKRAHTKSASSLKAAAPARIVLEEPGSPLMRSASLRVSGAREFAPPDLTTALSLSELACSLSSKEDRSVKSAEAALFAELVHAEVLEELGRVEESERLLLKLLERHPQSVPCLIKYARFLRRHGDDITASQLEALGKERAVPSLALAREALRSRLAIRNSTAFDGQSLREAFAAQDEVQHFLWVNGTLLSTRGTWVDLLSLEELSYWDNSCDEVVVDPKPVDVKIYDLYGL